MDDDLNPLAYDQKTPATLVRFESRLDSFKGVELYFCSRCRQVTVGAMPEGIQTPCPQCSCSEVGCFTQKAPKDVFCARHRADAQIMRGSWQAAKDSRWYRELMAKPPSPLGDHFSSPLFDPMAGEFFDSFEDWMANHDPAWLEALTEDHPYLLLPCSQHKAVNPFAQENLEVLAEETWGAFNPVLEHPELSLAFKMINDLTQRLRPVDVFPVKTRRICPYREYSLFMGRELRAEQVSKNRRTVHCEHCGENTVIPHNEVEAMYRSLGAYLDDLPEQPEEQESLQ